MKKIYNKFKSEKKTTQNTRSYKAKSDTEDWEEGGLLVIIKKTEVILPSKTKLSC